MQTTKVHEREPGGSNVPLIGGQSAVLEQLLHKTFTETKQGIHLFHDSVYKLDVSEASDRNNPC